MTDGAGARRLPRARHSLRRRIALTFAGAVVVTALTLTLSAYLITRNAQEGEAVDKALTQSRFNLYLADSVLPASPEPDDFSALLEAFAIRGDFETLILAGDETYVSGPQVGSHLITPELAARVAEGRLGYQMIEVGGGPALAVGGELREGDITSYFFYPQDDRLADLARLGTVLVIAGAVLAGLGAAAGYLLARRVLRPVRDAGKAAALMAQGDLDIRLPEGSDEFGTMNASFNRMAENLRGRMTDLEEGQARERRSVADVAHELRTPVAALVGEVSLLMSRLEADPAAASPEVARLATLLAGDVGRLRRLVDDLLEISRLDAHAVEAFIEPVDLIPFLDQVVGTHGWASAVSISRAEGGESTVVRADKRLLERIIVNLLQNALQHGAPPVQMEVVPGVTAGSMDGAAGAGGEAFIEVIVTDSGPGIPPERLPHLFDRFYKSDPSRSSGRGSGLGLAIARANARLLGGELTAEGAAPPGWDARSATGPGATFILSLPSARAFPEP